MSLTAKQKRVNGDVWYVWKDKVKVNTIKRGTNGKGGQQLFAIAGFPNKFTSIDKCLEFLEEVHDGST